MSMLVVGELRDVDTRMAGRSGGDQWEETILYVLDGRSMLNVAVAQGRNFTFRGEVPTRADVGRMVVLEVGVRAFVRNVQQAPPADGESPRGQAGYAVTAFGRSAEVEAYLNERAGLAKSA